MEKSLVRETSNISALDETRKIIGYIRFILPKNTIRHRLTQKLQDFKKKNLYTFELCYFLLATGFTLSLSPLSGEGKDREIFSLPCRLGYFLGRSIIKVSC